MTLDAEQRRALELLATAPRGLTEESLSFVHGFDVEVAGLVRDRLARAQAETVMAGGRAIEVVRVKITDAGGAALEADDQPVRDWRMVTRAVCDRLFGDGPIPVSERGRMSAGHHPRFNVGCHRNGLPNIRSEDDSTDETTSHLRNDARVGPKIGLDRRRKADARHEGGGRQYFHAIPPSRTCVIGGRDFQ